MTTNRRGKKLVRELMAATGLKYTEALAEIREDDRARAEGAPLGVSPVSSPPAPAALRGEGVTVASVPVVEVVRLRSRLRVS